MNQAIIFLLLASPQFVAGNLLSTAIAPPQLVPVTVQVDFGTAGRPMIEKEVQVPEGATPKQALKKMCEVTEGKVCCHPGEVKGIDGVIGDPAQGRYWRLTINGNGKDASPHRSRLKAHDQVSWIYFEDK